MGVEAPEFSDDFRSDYSVPGFTSLVPTFDSDGIPPGFNGLSTQFSITSRPNFNFGSLGNDVQALFESSLLDQGNQIATLYTALRCRTVDKAEAHQQSCTT